MSEYRGELIIYQTEDGLTKIDVRMDNDTVWLSLDQMAELFQRDKSTISRHIKNVFVNDKIIYFNSFSVRTLNLIPFDSARIFASFHLHWFFIHIFKSLIKCLF